MRPPTSLAAFKIKQENVKLSDVILQHTVESTACKQTEQQLKSLQDWVNEVVGK